MKRLIMTCLLFLGHFFLEDLHAETLAELNTEYTAKRTSGLQRLNDAAKVQLEVVKQGQMSAGSLAGANATNAAIADLPTIAANPAKAPNTTAESLPPEAGRILTDHSSKVCAGVVGLNKLYIPRYEALKTVLLQQGDLNAANAADGKAKEMNQENSVLTPMMTAKDNSSGKDASADKPFTIEGYVDGNTELHITKEGFYWAVIGGEAKVGMNDDNHEPCYVNGSRWKPKWRTLGTRGPDMCDLYPFPIRSLDLTAEVVSTTNARYGKAQIRAPISSGLKGDHFVVNVPDPEGGAAWYKIRLKPVGTP